MTLDTSISNVLCWQGALLLYVMLHAGCEIACVATFQCWPGGLNLDPPGFVAPESVGRYVVNSVECDKVVVVSRMLYSCAVGHSQCCQQDVVKS